MPKNCPHERDICSKFLYLIAKQYKWTWFAYYVEEKQHIIKVCSSENKQTNKTARKSHPAETWQQHRLLCHEAFLLYIIEVKVKLTRPLKAWTFTNLVRRMFSNIPRFFVYILPWMEVETSPKSGTAKQNANCKPYAVFECYIKYPRSNSPIYMDFFYPIFVNLISK